MERHLFLSTTFGRQVQHMPFGQQSHYKSFSVEFKNIQP